MTEESSHLEKTLRRIDGRGYKTYKEIEGVYDFPGFRLFVDHVQGDPFAAPSRIRARVMRPVSGFGPETTASPSRQTALCDYLTRSFHHSCTRIARGERGTGKSGLITIDRPPQEILARTAMAVDDRLVEARFFMGLPAVGRKISGRHARAMFFEELPKIVQASLYARSLSMPAVMEHIETAEDAHTLRRIIADRGLVGFVGDGSLLPRASGIDPGPLKERLAVRFESPASLKTKVRLPNRGIVSGMGIPQGVTLIVGGGFHGKSTLLNALELGVYNHLPGDGREMTVSLEAAVKIRAADGRSVAGVDISPFIDNLPFKKDTNAFFTANASGSTSQAANISEAIETGAKVLLLDEDTSATNFMIRDRRMQMLVEKANEPITPFVDRVRQLYDDLGISTVLVMGGSGDYFQAADTVIRMNNYRPEDVTERAHDIAAENDTGRIAEGGEPFGALKKRIPLKQGFDPFSQHRRTKIAAPRRKEILFGRTRIDLGDLEQIVDSAQTRGLAHGMHRAVRHMDGQRTLREVVDCVLKDVAAGGLECLTPYLTGDIAAFRAFELAGAINRMRTLHVRQAP
ncbi:MAG: ABC-ATPase domain-containing protein [Deltaproteobacteria bacterium]|nr:ABC-ATPase domain-containing protein [Deltaproteobacteria bacterium]